MYINNLYLIQYKVAILSVFFIFVFLLAIKYFYTKQIGCFYEKALIYSLLVVGSTFGILSVNAELDTSVSGGHAWSSYKTSSKTTSKCFQINRDVNPIGLNLKYRYEIDPQLGSISSFAYLGKKERAVIKNDISGIISDHPSKFNYYSLLIGLSYRFNKWVSVYTAAGIAYSKRKIQIDGNATTKQMGNPEPADMKKTSPAGMIGFQFNPLPNIVTDLSYEYAKMAGGQKRGVLAISLGTRF
ncbi:Ail/Lom family outer membrane beta-barrel protein [Candidatus Williamhamiltonella defendens]|uniref:Ail/Lom family outer membrane beta-barrel protein n=1 Tax=Candidatus Williamhamiltonella defendens TaxID=138072 RepID=UPI00130EB051|nr:Ail/Lom family outer membrane beta-barrel protein [Candidatus Hamiltonella defensa]